jgi:PIN domain nuclease of toxin-antitoxin system
VRVLLDTQALVWALLDDPRLSEVAKAAITDAQNEILVSPASLWELAIKISLRKYSLNEDFTTFMETRLLQSGFTLLPIGVRHLGVVATLPFHHRDPFDRLIVAQAVIEQVPIVSSDAAFDAYLVNRLW